MVITSTVPVVLSILASIVGGVTPCTVLKLTKSPFIIVLGTRLKHRGIITAGQPSLTSFDSGLLQDRLKDKARPTQISNHIYSSFGEEPFLILFPGNDGKFRGMRNRGSFKQFGILTLYDGYPLK